MAICLAMDAAASWRNNGLTRTLKVSNIIVCTGYYSTCIKADKRKTIVYMNNNRWLGMSFTIAKMWKLFIHLFFCRGKFRSCHSEVGLLTYQSFTVLHYLRHYRRTIVDSSSFLGV